MHTINNLLIKLETLSKKYPKATQRIMWGILAVSAFIFLRLFLITAEFVSIGGGSGFMNMGGIPIPWFLWKWNTTLAVLGFAMAYVGYRLIKQKAAFQKQLLIIFLCFVYALGSYPIFKQLDPDLAFTFGTEQDYYLESDGSVNVDKYIATMIRFCIHPKYGCPGKGQNHFKTTQEYIKALEAFKKADSYDDYQGVIGGAERYGFLEDLIEKYEDKTFYVYLIFNKSDKKLLHLLKTRITDKEILNVIIFYDKKLKEVEEIQAKNPDENTSEMWQQFLIEFANKVREIPGINQTIVHV